MCLGHGQRWHASPESSAVLPEEPWHVSHHPMGVKALQVTSRPVVDVPPPPKGGADPRPPRKSPP